MKLNNNQYKFFGRRFTPYFCMLFLFFTLPSQSEPITLQLAKENHWVGETLNGYIDHTTESLHKKTIAKSNLIIFVDNINQKRTLAYQEIASQNHLSTEIIAKIAGQKLVENAIDGEYIKGINGQWTQKKQAQTR